MRKGRAGIDKLRDLDKRVQQQAAIRASSLDPRIAQAGAEGIASRAKEYAGRSANEQADMLVNYMANARKMQGDMSKEAPMIGQASPIDLRRMTQAIGAKGAGGQGKYKNKGTIDAPKMTAAAAEQILRSAPSGGRDFTRTMAEGVGPDARTQVLMAQRQINENMAADGTMGQISRGMAYAGVTGGITASGAALVDLMKYLAQGQQVDTERDNVLTS
ncbi:MAG: hypothetical protein CBD74_09370 [Saprospirales bacterium TMED214]|nr:MAG: hypothetical protein CBD74_09370 [Saprospirales bacterium TMED214]